MHGITSVEIIYILKYKSSSAIRQLLKIGPIDGVQTLKKWHFEGNIVIITVFFFFFTANESLDKLYILNLNSNLIIGPNCICCLVYFIFHGLSPREINPRPQRTKVCKILCGQLCSITYLVH